jgi:hypothetical protein
VRIGRIADHVRAIHRGSLGNQKVGTGNNPIAGKNKCKTERKQKNCFFHRNVLIDE